MTGLLAARALRMRKSQAYAGLISGEPQPVPRNCVLIIYPPVTGIFGSILVTFRNGSTPVTLDVGYGQPLSIVPLDGRIVATVTLVSGVLNYYTTDRDLASSFQSVASSPGGDIIPPVSSEFVSSGNQNITVFTVPTGYSLTLQGVIAQLRNSGGSNLTYTTFSIQVYRGASGPLNGVFETILIDSSGETLGGGDDWMYAAIEVATSASNLTYSIGGSGTIIGSKFGAMTPITLYPGDYILLNINLSTYTSGLYADTRVVGVLTPL